MKKKYLLALVNKFICLFCGTILASHGKLHQCSFTKHSCITMVINCWVWWGSLDSKSLGASRSQ